MASHSYSYSSSSVSLTKGNTSYVKNSAVINNNGKTKNFNEEYIMQNGIKKIIKPNKQVGNKQVGNKHKYRLVKKY